MTTSNENTGKVWFDWDINYNLPKLNFKDVETLNLWTEGKLNFKKIDIGKQSSTNFHLYFLTMIVEKIRYSIYNFETISQVFVLSVQNKLKYILEVKEDNYKFCLECIIKTASTLEDYEMCIDIQNIIKDIDDIREFMDYEKINHRRTHAINF